MSSSPRSSRVRNTLRLAAGQTILLLVLLAWALVMIVPDLWHVMQPLGSFGFYANNDGLIYDVTGPFDDQTAA
jgi:hypothetical protein